MLIILDIGSPSQFYPLRGACFFSQLSQPSISSFPFMASLPTFTISGTPELDPEFRKHAPNSFLPEKRPSMSFKKSDRITHLDGSLDPRYRDFREALSLKKEGTKVETSFYIPLLQECIDKSSLSEAQIVHGHIIKTGTLKDVFIMTFLVNVYAKCGNMESSRKVFDKMPKRNVAAWNKLMVGYVQNSQPEHAIHVFQNMLDAGVYPSIYTLAIALSACSSLDSVKLGDQFYAYIIKYHIDSDTSIGNALCSLYSKCKRLKSALKAFHRIKEKDVISWSAAISACGNNGKAIRGLKLFIEMLSEDIQPNELTLSSVLSLCCDILSLELGTQVHSLTTKLGYQSDLHIRNSLMYLYLKCGRIVEADILFDGMDDTSLVTWSVMIAGHAQMMQVASDNISAYQSGIEALNLFLKLNGSRMKPDQFSFSSVLRVCSGLVALEQGEQIHAQTIKTGFLSNVIVGTSLMDMYNKCGTIEKASKAFVEMPTRTLISWTSMITGFALHGRSQQALQLFDDMRLAGVRPNRITFVGVISACSHAGMVEEALNYFQMMQKEYKLKPVMDHYVCLIDMFVRLGQLEEAFSFIKKMELEPSEFIWTNLIVGCRSHGNLELGFYAAEQLLSLKPKDTETYVLLLNMYLSAGRFEDVSRVRRIMEEEKVGKLKDWSWISIKDKVYSFEPNDKAHPQSSLLYRSLEDLLAKAKSVGYESLEVESMELIDEEDKGKKSSSIIYESEKLAITFGLENLPNCSPVRVIKSTIMSRDSHNFIKYVSTLTDREIIIRDSKRLHKFVNGQCLCGDYGVLF